jgi:hypothetical protein
MLSGSQVALQLLRAMLWNFFWLAQKGVRKRVSWCFAHFVGMVVQMGDGVAAFFGVGSMRFPP